MGLPVTEFGTWKPEGIQDWNEEEEDKGDVVVVEDLEEVTEATAEEGEKEVVIEAIEEEIEAEVTGSMMTGGRREGMIESMTTGVTDHVEDIEVVVRMEPEVEVVTEAVE